MPRTVISGLVCITFLMLLESSAVPQPARKGADAATESGQLTFNNACRTCHTTKERRQSLGPKPPQYHRKKSRFASELRLFQCHEGRGVCMG